MKRLRSAHPIWHAVAWILAYILLTGVGDAVSELMGVPNAATAPILLLLAVALFAYVYRNGWSNYYGLHRLDRAQFRRTLLYLPLAALVLMQFFRDLRNDLDPTGVLLIVGLMVGVGFIEEVIFRGFLFRAILVRASLTRAIVISGVTFGIGHIVNLARGYTGAEQLLQIGVAVMLGIVLALLYAVSGTIVPLIAFHALFNIGGSLTVDSMRFDAALLAVTFVVSAGYAAYLITVLRTRGRHSSLREEPRPEPMPAIPDNAN